MTKKRVPTRVERKQKSAVSPMMIAGVAVIAVLLVVGLIWLGNRQESNLSATVDIGDFPTEGVATAPVTIVEYSDFGCPHCRDFVLEKSDQLRQEFVETGQVKYVVHPYTLRPETALATEAAWCAADQGQYFDYQRAVFDNFGVPFTQAGLISVAENVELDQSAFASCLSSREHQLDVENARRAAAQRGVNSTPTFFINDVRFEGNQPYENFQQAINQALASAQ